MLLLNILFCFVLLATPAYSARILGIASTASYSQQVAFRPLWRELSLRGHQVTVLTTDPTKDSTLTNLTEIDLSITYKKWSTINLNEIGKMNRLEMYEMFMALTNDIIEEQLLLPEVQQLRNSNEHFDLLMIEYFYPAMAAFSEKFNCPMIQIFSLDASSFSYHTLGNPSHPVLYPDSSLQFTGELNFFQRLSSVMVLLLMKYTLYYRFLPSQDALIKRHFGSDYPSLKEITKKTSMMFVNTDTVFHEIRPLNPNIIQFGGGTHLTQAKPLPKDLQAQLDNATDGFIYFSLGSNVKSENLPESTRKIFLETFAELPYPVLWKYEKEDLSDKPNNVIISKWFPQQDIFRHSNIKLFISQGGLQSFEEAIYNHIPIIGIPFFADQKFNVLKMVSKGLAQYVDSDTIDKQTLKKAILEALNNPMYRNNAKKLTELARDQPMSGIDRAIWWTEYVIRHKGAPHLRSPAMDLPDYQYFLLDVIGFCLAVLLIVTYILIKIVKLCYKLVESCLLISKIKAE